MCVIFQFLLKEIGLFRLLVISVFIFTSLNKHRLKLKEDDTDTWHSLRTADLALILRCLRTNNTDDCLASKAIPIKCFLVKFAVHCYHKYILAISLNPEGFDEKSNVLTRINIGYIYIYTLA